MQVDFGEITVRTTQGGKIKIYVIAFVLSHSRYKYAEWQDRPFTTRDVLRCHENAFQFYGGRTDEFVYDQDKLMSVSENGGDIIYTEEFQAYKQQRGFQVYLCRAADPESKGKVENVVKFIKRNFAKNRLFHQIDRWNEQCLACLKLSSTQYNKKEISRSVCRRKATLTRSLHPTLFREQPCTKYNKNSS